MWCDGKPITNRDFYEDWHAAADRAGLNGFIPHDSPRSASRNLRNRGVPQAMRMRVLGHKTDSMDRRNAIVDLADVDTVRELWRAGSGANHSNITPLKTMKGSGT